MKSAFNYRIKKTESLRFDKIKIYFLVFFQPIDKVYGVLYHYYTSAILGFYLFFLGIVARNPSKVVAKLLKFLTSQKIKLIGDNFFCLVHKF
ncbi:MAG TPA: hypothetical protein DCF68_20890 [Cyanothece sp. UBA12306]|nr:hypothetical protein [Cyanothece sp. UBA12306]